jgi:hypothetical protein
VVREAGDRRLDGRLAAAADRRWALRGWSIAAGLGVHWQPSGAIEAAADDHPVRRRSGAINPE